MTAKLSGVINYLIGAGLMTYILFILKRKNAEQAGMGFLGWPIEKFMLIIYAGIAIDVILIVTILLGWQKY